MFFYITQIHAASAAAAAAAAAAAPAQEPREEKQKNPKIQEELEALSSEPEWAAVFHKKIGIYTQELIENNPNADISEIVKALAYSFETFNWAAKQIIIMTKLLIKNKSTFKIAPIIYALVPIRDKLTFEQTNAIINEISSKTSESPDNLDTEGQIVTMLQTKLQEAILQQATNTTAQERALEEYMKKKLKEEWKTFKSFNSHYEDIKRYTQELIKNNPDADIEGIASAFDYAFSDMAEYTENIFKMTKMLIKNKKTFKISPIILALINLVDEDPKKAEFLVADIASKTSKLPDATQTENKIVELIESPTQQSSAAEKSPSAASTTGSQPQ